MERTLSEKNEQKIFQTRLLISAAFGIVLSVITVFLFLRLSPDAKKNVGIIIFAGLFAFGAGSVGLASLIMPRVHK